MLYFVNDVNIPHEKSYTGNLVPRSVVRTLRNIEQWNNSVITKFHLNYINAVLSGP